MGIENTFRYTKFKGKQVIPVIYQGGTTVRSLELYELFAVRSLFSGEARSRKLNPQGPHNQIFSTPFNEELLVIEPQGDGYSPFSPEGFEKLKDLSSGLELPTIIQDEKSHHVLRLEFHSHNEIPENVSRILGYYSPAGSSRPHALLYFSFGVNTNFTKPITPDEI